MSDDENRRRDEEEEEEDVADEGDETVVEEDEGDEGEVRDFRLDDDEDVDDSEEEDPRGAVGGGVQQSPDDITDQELQDLRNQVNQQLRLLQRQNVLLQNQNQNQPPHLQPPLPANPTMSTNPPAPNPLAPAGGAAQAAGAGAAQAAGTNSVSGSQLNTIPIFKGDRAHEDIELWIDQVERAARRCGWSDQATAAAALTRMEDGAAQWIRASEKRGKNLDDWPTLKAALMLDFAEPLNNLAAARAVINLQQKVKEDVQTFFDRVVLAVDRKNFNYTEAEKQLPEYRSAQEKDIYMFFAAGLREEFRDRALAGTSPPTDADSLLAAAKNIEKELYRARAPDISVAEISVGENSMSLQEQIAALTAEIAAMRPGATGGASGRANVVCYHCNKKGHYKRDCFLWKKESAATRTGGARPKTRSSGRNFGKNKKSKSKKYSSTLRPGWKVSEVEEEAAIQDDGNEESENSEEEE